MAPRPEGRMTTLFLDCETTGVEPTARMVTVAWAWLEGESSHFLVRCDDFEIPPFATGIHGISTIAAKEFGCNRGEILNSTRYCISLATLVVAHNIDFDSRVINYEISLLGEAISWPQTFCTMKALTPIIKLPSRTGDGHKWPTLAEAYRFMFDRKPEGLHCARTDMLACREIYLEGQQRGYW